tara:strand:+ start:1290 stop:2030 length:741 start_codon:yes stop_codon:yes gene_type:complete
LATEVNKDTTHDDHEYTTTGLNHRKMLMWAFLGSDCMFFGALIATYLVYQGKSLVGPYPIDVFDIPVTSVSTFVLLMSSMSMVLAYAALTQNKMNGFRIWMASTAIMGATFVGFQVYEFSSFSTFHVDIESCNEKTVKHGIFDDYEEELCAKAKEDHVETHDGLKPQTNLFGTTFYTLTGFHGAHVTLGIIWILSLLFLSYKKGKVTPESHLDVDLAALYWHFVDVVWIVIFTVIYLFGVFPFPGS